MQMLTRVKIPEQARKYPGQLSGGQQQGLPSPVPGHAAQGDALRRADLGPRPRDDQGGSRRHGRAGQGGMTMIVVTHEMGFARAVANRVVFMADGEIVEVGSPEHFFTSPQEERTKLFLSQIL